MARVIVAVALIAVLCAAEQGAQEEKSASVQKVIQMLGDMLAKAKMEKQTEEIHYAEFSTWCSDEKVNLAKSIKSEGESIELLSNGIGKSQSDIKGLGQEIATLQADLAKFDADLKSEVSQRKKDYAAFQAESQDFAESVDAIERAVAVLQKQSFDRKGSASALLQVAESAQLNPKARAMIQAFMGMMDANEDGAPESNAYEFQSGSVVDMLKKLRDDLAASSVSAKRKR